MAKIVIVGAGVVGLGAGLLLCGDGHEVAVLERDAEAAPVGADEIWGTWQRNGVNQFRLPHFFLARYRDHLDSELPEVKQQLFAAGAVRRNPGLLDKAIAWGAGWRGEPLPAPSRGELLSIVAGG